MYIGKKEAIKDFPDADKFIKPSDPGYKSDKKATYTIFKDDGQITNYDLTDVQDIYGLRAGTINKYPGGVVGDQYSYYQNGRYTDISIRHRKAGEVGYTPIFGYRRFYPTTTLCTWGKYEGSYAGENPEYIATYGHELE
nr:MAG TPA: hypothetical protein [Caudoviricetes sp.]